MRKAALVLAACVLTSCGAPRGGARPPVAQPEPGSIPRVGAPALVQILAREVGGEWQAAGDLVRLFPGKGLPFEIHHAPCQRSQEVVLERYESWVRPMAIIWAGNGWTLVGDADAWMRDRAKVLRVVAVLEKTQPDHATWKPARERN